jgi:hypothetical protein
MSFWVDRSGCGGVILLFASTVGMASGNRESGDLSFESVFSALLTILLMFVCPVGWLGLHAAACKKAAHYASEAI